MSKYKYKSEVKVKDTALPVRYFYNEFREIITEVIQNPCGCHPCDLSVTWGKKFGESVSYRFKNDLEVEEFLEKWIKL